jgi:hypothetical protein
MKLALSIALLALTSSGLFGATESVRVAKVLDDDKVIIVRRNGESYLIEKGVGCLSLWRFEGKSVLITSPGLFLGVGSSLVLPDADQECRIWDSEPVGNSSHGSARPSSRKPARSERSAGSGSNAGTLSVQKALKIVGLHPGIARGVMNDETRDAFRRYRVSKGLPQSDYGNKMTLLTLAIEVLEKGPARDSAQLATQLQSLAGGVGSSAGSKSGCADGHWVQAVLSSGELVKLEDGSLWQIDALDTIDTMLWLPTEEVMVCGGTLINTDNGDKVTAKQLR